MYKDYTDKCTNECNKRLAERQRRLCLDNTQRQNENSDDLYPISYDAETARHIDEDYKTI